MSIDTLKPQTLAGIKSLAKELKALHNLPLHEAQRQASISGGFQNFEHARKALKKSPGHTNEVYVTNYWADDRTGKSGRLTFCVPLPKSIKELLGLQGSGIADQFLAAYKLEFDDHIELRHDLPSYAKALERGQSVALALQFMDLTGLRSANGRLPESAFKALASSPNSGQMSGWVDPSTPDNWVILDEPNGYRQRPAWAASKDVHAELCHGFGLHRGGGLRTTVIANSQKLASGVATTLRTIHEDKQTTSHHEGSYSSVFVSPSRKKIGAERKSRPMPHPEGTIKNNSIAYGEVAGEYSHWRPNFKLPIEDHLKIGPILEALTPCYILGTQNPLLTSVRLDLCNWFFREHDSAITTDLEQAYNGVGFQSVVQQHIIALKPTSKKREAIGTVISILTHGYPRCNAVDKQIERLLKIQADYS